MDFTREPIIETVITPKDGYRIVVRNSRQAGQEEFVVDALEVVHFGTASFFRNRERAKAFLVPVSEYEIVEVRDPRVGLKVASFEASFKSSRKQSLKEKDEKKEEPAQKEEIAPVAEERFVEKRKKKGGRKKRKDEPVTIEEPIHVEKVKEKSVVENENKGEKEDFSGDEQSKRTILPPPTTLIKDEIERLRQSEEYQGAFYLNEEGSKSTEAEVPIGLSEEKSTENSPPAPAVKQDLYIATPEPLDDDVMVQPATGDDKG